MRRAGIREQGLVTPASKNRSPGTPAGIRGGIACVAVLMAGSAVSQQIQLGEGPVPRGKDHVVLLSDAIDVPAGKAQMVELRFRVDPGYHINSHTPKDELLIPTALKLDASQRLSVMDEQYPAGLAFRLLVGDGELLDVYQNEFRVSLRVVVPKGATTLTGALRYQACDSSACYPPRMLPVKVAVTGR